MTLSDDFEGLTLDQLEDLAWEVFDCLEANPEDPECFEDAYRLSRSVLPLVEQHRILKKQLEVVSAQLDLVRKAKGSS